MNPAGKPAPLPSVWVAGAAFAIYLALATPVARWGDAVDLARRATSSPLTPYGRSYPLQSALIRAVEALGADPARASSIVSALIAGVGVGLLHWVCRRYLMCGRVAAVGAAAAFGVNHVYWTSAVDGEVYGLLALYSVAALGAVLASRGSSSGAWSCGLLAGLVPLHHRASLFMLPVLLVAPLVLAAAQRRRATALRLGAGVAIGCVPFAALVIAEGARRATGFDAELWSSITVGAARNATLFTEQPRALLPSCAYVVRWTLFCFPGVALPIAAWGLVCLTRRDRAVGGLVLALGAAAMILPLRMGGVGDRYVFLAAVFPVVGLGLAVGLSSIQQWRGTTLVAVCAAACALVPPITYLSCAAGSSAQRLLPGLTREAAHDFFVPIRTGSPGSSAWAADVLAALQPEGSDDPVRLVYAEWGAGAALEYAQFAKGLAPGVRILRRMPSSDEMTAAGARGVTVAVTPIWADERSRLEPLGTDIERLAPSLYRVRRRR